MTSIAHDYLADITAELREIGADDLIHYAGAAHRDPVACAVIAAYVVERDAQFARGRQLKWLVEGPGAPRLGICCSTRPKAERYRVRYGESTHTVRVGYGDDHSFYPITDAQTKRAAMMALQGASHETIGAY